MFCFKFRVSWNFTVKFLINSNHSCTYTRKRDICACSNIKKFVSFFPPSESWLLFLKLFFFSSGANPVQSTLKLHGSKRDYCPCLNIKIKKGFLAKEVKDDKRQNWTVNVTDLRRGSRVWDEIGKQRINAKCSSRAQKMHSEVRGWIWKSAPVTCCIMWDILRLFGEVPVHF